MSKYIEDKVRENLERLTRRQGAGFFGDPVASMTEDRFLVIGPGGTGHEGGSQVLQEAKETFLPNEIRNKLRILAVDTDHEQLDAQVAAGRLNSDQILPLPYAGVYEAIENNPSLADFVPAGYTTYIRKADGFDGKGAGSRPLNGRILLTSGQAAEAVRDKISALAGELMAARFMTGATTLHVIFLCSFCGGTGAGTIVDLAYMTHHILESLSIPYDITCYALTPSACRNNDTEKTNFIATLKTVRHFMNIHYNGGAFRHAYAPGFTVNCKENIFKGFYLIDGQRSGALSTDPHGEALTTAARSIINTMIL